MIGSPGEGEYGEKSDFFCSPRQGFVTVGVKSSQYLIDSYNTYLTCTDSDFSNGASYKCKNISSSSSTRAPSIGIIIRLRACPLRPVMLFSPNQESGPLQAARKNGDHAPRPSALNEDNPGRGSRVFNQYNTMEYCRQSLLLL